MVSTLLIHTMIFKSLTLRRKTLIQLTFSIGSQGGLSKLFLYFAKNPHKIKGHPGSGANLSCPASFPIPCVSISPHFFARQAAPSVVSCKGAKCHPPSSYTTRFFPSYHPPLRQPAIPILKISHIIGVAMGNSRFTKACAP